MNQYMFLFHSDPAKIAHLSPSEMQDFLQEWAQWMGSLAQAGHLVSGEQLAPASKIVRGRSRVISDGPYSEAKEAMGGYVIVTAATLEAAAELSANCPVLNDGGAVEVRQIMNR